MTLTPETQILSIVWMQVLRSHTEGNCTKLCLADVQVANANTREQKHSSAINKSVWFISPSLSLSLSPAAELHRLKYRSRDVLKENVHLIKSDMLEKVCLMCRFVMVCGKLMTVSCCLLSSPQTHCLGSSLQGKPPHLSSVHNLLRTKHQTDVIRDWN